jgi:hypothetical protein
VNSATDTPEGGRVARLQSRQSGSDLQRDRRPQPIEPARERTSTVIIKILSERWHGNYGNKRGTIGKPERLAGDGMKRSRGGTVPGRQLQCPDSVHG